MSPLMGVMPPDPSPWVKRGGSGGRVGRHQRKLAAGGSLGIKNDDGEWMGGGWGADEAGLRARGERILRGSVDALER